MTAGTRAPRSKPVRIKFTNRALDSIAPPPAGQRFTFHDENTPGLAVRVTPAGVKTFVVFRKFERRPERVTLGRFPQMTIDQARRKTAEVNALIAEGKNPNEKRRAIRDEMTFGDLFALYLERHAKVHKKTWEKDLAHYRNHLEPWASRKLSRIGPSDVQALHAKIGLESGPYLANRIYALLRTLFRKAQEWGWKGANPAQGVKRFKEISRERFIQPDEAPRFFRALAEEPSRAFRDYVVLSLMTGARRANVSAMRWADLHLDMGLWTIPETKNGQAHTIPLVQMALDVLTARKEEAGHSPWVFPAESRSGHMVEVKRAWRRLFDRDELHQLTARLAAAGHPCSASPDDTLSAALAHARREAQRHKIDTAGARIADLRIHDLRRTLGSWQAAAGASLSIIGKTLGHRSVSATAIYARLNHDPVRDAIETATRNLMAAAQGDKAEVVPIAGARRS